MEKKVEIEELKEFSTEEDIYSDRINPFRWVLSHALKHWWLIGLAFMGAVINALLAALLPILIGQGFNLVNSDSASDFSHGLKNIALIILISQLIRAGVMFLRNFAFEVTAQRIERNIRQELYISLLGKSMTFHNLQPVGDTMARATNDVREVNYMFSPGINLVFGSANFLFMPIIFSVRYHPSLIIVPILYLILYVISISAYLKKLRPITDKVRSSFGKLNTRLSESIDGIETVKGAAQERFEISLFEKNISDYRNAFVLQGNEEAKFIPLLLMSLTQAAGLFHALFLFKGGVIEVGDVVSYFGLLLLLGFPTFISLFAFSQISLGMAGSRRILELINRENVLGQNKMGYQGELSGNVTFQDVSFAYEDQNIGINDISFKVESGKKVAIVGQTGSGKTTLVKLINRIYDSTDGVVKVDGIDVRDWNLETLRKNISIIEQDIFLFSKTIKENIAFGFPEANFEEIKTAAKLAQAHEFILTFRDGYDTVLGERGVTLSGGQKQRIALARAFLTDPKILILDDSTSAIDSKTEDKIQQAIFAAAHGRTTFIITHRLSQIRWADIIVVMKGGCIDAIGNHDELMETSLAYSNLFKE
ncbi:MAG: ABC transporter ATP-binding protein [Bacteroidales bacterium]|nr:ABC transporter ATP-binding protein [Bacteroidales bacterium]